MASWRASLGGCVAALALLGAAPASAEQPPGPDGHGTDYFVTIAARECPTYEDITANRARNNIQESLRDLGPDTPYAAGEEVDLDTEERVQPNCTPLTGWRFTIGDAIAPDRVTGVWGALSVVSGADPTDITTLASIPRRNNIGQIHPNKTVQGATTIELTRAQLDRAPGGNLWIQGGTPTDPVLFGDFPDEFGFGALRCATDNVNGDNVEYIRFPTGSRHVYCFAYYVTPPPTSGTIVIRKQVTEPAGADQTFTFEGNISFTPDQRFDLSVVNGSTPSHTFFRAETHPTDAPWTVRELVPSGWVLTGLTCTQTNSAVTVDQAAASVSIRLVAGDTVTCTFKDALRPPPGNLLLSKITHGGLGTFGFTVTPEGSDSPVARTSATTTSEGDPADAESGPIELDPGTYDVAERLPRARNGHWRHVAVNCGARRRAVGARAGLRRHPPPVQVRITAGAGVACVFENRFVPSGAIAITKTTRGATGTTSFQITPEANPARQLVQTAKTTEENKPALARGDSTRRLRLGRYVIQETGTSPEGDGRWTLVEVICDGRLRGFGQGEMTVALTRDNPRVVCRFVDVFTPKPPPSPPTPNPQPSPEPSGPQPDLVVTKRALQGRVAFGRIATFEIVVRNQGAAAAQQVVVADLPGSSAQLVSARPSKGGCNERTPLICRLGQLDAGEQATIRVRVRAVGTPKINNQAVAGSATPESTLANNFDRAQVRVRSQGGVRGIICSLRPVAHAAC
jgi:uncharacterized repeat protein (TIGR01451 family)